MVSIAVASDEKNNVTNFVVRYLKEKGHEVKRFGALASREKEWVDSSRELAEYVAKGNADQGVLFCWTGTGASITANKVPGIRAALCVDAGEARGAKRWNHANVLVMSLGLTSEPLAKEILDSWFSEPFGKSSFDKRNIKKLETLEKRYRR